jgi:hypothetical protein
MANFPSTDIALGTLVDNVDYPQAAHLNNAYREIEAIGNLISEQPFLMGFRLTWNSATSVSIGAGACIAADGSLINSKSAITKGSLSLSATTWYHIYVYLNSGTPAAEVVTTAPAAWIGTAYSKTGDTSRRYVGSIKTDGSGNVYEFLHIGSNIYYSASLATSPFRVLSAGAATTDTAVDCSAVVPVTTRGVRLFVSAIAAVVVARILTSGGTAMMGIRPASASQIDTFTDANQDVFYSNSAGGGDTYIDVVGYVLER